MSGKITTFFSKGADTKREREDDAQVPVESMADEAAASPSKRPRRTRAAADPKTAELEARAEENRKKALAKLAAKADKLPAVAAAAAAAAAVTAASPGESLERRTMDPSWYAKLSGEFSKPYFKELQAFLASERASGAVIYPPEEEVYSWSRYCPLDQVRVVILGQDPYINERQAHGLAFSVNVGVPPPPSLVNMYKELVTDIPGFEVPKHGSLVSWAKQGVLLLNAALTVRAGKCTADAQ